jgi:DNA-directed RNA polymerase
LEVEFAREKSEESQLARMEKRSTLTELERGIEDRSDSEFREKRPSLESELLRRRREELG